MEDTENIPRSILRYDTAHVDWGDFEDGKILFLCPDYVLVGKGDVPHTLFATPQFSEETLVSNIGESIYKIKRIFLQSSFSTKTDVKDIHYLIPEWLPNFKEVDYLKFSQADLNNLDCLKDMPIQHLILIDIKISNKDSAVSAIKRFQNLKAIEYDQSLPGILIKQLEDLDLMLVPIL